MRLPPDVDFASEWQNLARRQSQQTVKSFVCEWTDDAKRIQDRAEFNPYAVPGVVDFWCWSLHRDYFLVSQSREQSRLRQIEIAALDERMAEIAAILREDNELCKWETANDNDPIDIRLFPFV